MGDLPNDDKHSLTTPPFGSLQRTHFMKSEAKEMELLTNLLLGKRASRQSNLRYSTILA